MNKKREIIAKRTMLNAERLLLKHIDRFNNLLYGVQISKDTFSFRNKLINGKVKSLTRIIENELYNLCLTNSNHDMLASEDQEEVLEFILRDRPGGNLVESIRNHVGKLNNEVEAYIEASLYFDLQITEGLSILKKNLSNAYNNKFIRKAYREIRNPNSLLIKSKGATVDSGHYKTSVANIKRLLGFVVIETLTNRMVNEFKREGAIGYFVSRGSSYPCDYCDSFVGFHDINDVSSIPPFHGSCYCIVEPVY